MRDEAVPRPLEGVRVLEFSQAIAAPTCGRYLAALGAEVIKMENLMAPDLIRAMGPSWLTADVHPLVKFDVPPMGGEYVSGKLSCGLNISAPRGRELLEDLLRASDVVVINYSASAIKNLSLRGEDVLAVNPAIVYCGLPGFGYDEDAPYFTYKAWGPNQAPISGIDHLTGYPGEDPSGLGSFSYPDFTGGMQAAFSILAAVFDRDLTGAGQIIDMSQMEVAVAALGPVVLDYTANGVNTQATGNRVPWAAPQGTYPAWGRERWIVISCTEDAHWDALCTVAERAEFVSDPRFATVAGRQDHADALDAALSDWTAGHPSRDLAYRLQAAGCPAYLVADQADLLVDPQLETRRAYSVADHARVGKDFTLQFPVHMSLAQPRMPRGTPTFGQDNEYIFEKVLGITAEERATLAGEGVIFETIQPELRFENPQVRWVRHLWRDDWPAAR